MILDRIGFAFENCEYLEISGKYIFHLHCGDIKYDISMHNCDCSFISQSKRFSNFSVGILSEASSAKLLDSCLFDEYRDSIDRLRNCDDLVAVDLVFKETHSDQYSPLSGYYYVPWGGDDDYSNKAIRYSGNGRGDMFIAIDTDYMNEAKDTPKDHFPYFNGDCFYNTNYLKNIAEERNLKVWLY